MDGDTDKLCFFFFFSFLLSSFLDFLSLLSTSESEDDPLRFFFFFFAFFEDVGFGWEDDLYVELNVEKSSFKISDEDFWSPDMISLVKLWGQLLCHNRVLFTHSCVFRVSKTCVFGILECGLNTHFD